LFDGGVAGILLPTPPSVQIRRFREAGEESTDPILIVHFLKHFHQKPDQQLTIPSYLDLETEESSQSNVKGE
jgi:hypothetical protein